MAALRPKFKDFFSKYGCQNGGLKRLRGRRRRNASGGADGRGAKAWLNRFNCQAEAAALLLYFLHAYRGQIDLRGKRRGMREENQYFIPCTIKSLTHSEMASNPPRRTSVKPPELLLGRKLARRNF